MSPRAIRTGSSSPLKLGNERMPGISLRSSCAFGFFLSLIVTAGVPASALNLRGARVEALSFAMLDGWKDDDHAAAFDTFLKSCRAILNGTRAMRSARPFYGALFKVCDRAVAAGQLDRDHARGFFEINFKTIRVTPAGLTGGFFIGYYETCIEGSTYTPHIYTSPPTT